MNFQKLICRDGFVSCPYKSAIYSHPFVGAAGKTSLQMVADIVFVYNVWLTGLLG